MMFEYVTYPQPGNTYYNTNPAWSIGALDDDSNLGAFPISGDDIALYRAGVERAS